MTNRIHLGLDLRGGTHLILQVQVNDAINVDSDNAVEVLKEQLNKRRSPSPIFPSQTRRTSYKIVIKGVPAEARKDLLDIANYRLPEYNLTSGADNSWTLVMKPANLSDLKNKAEQYVLLCSCTSFSYVWSPSWCLLSVGRGRAGIHVGRVRVAVR